MTLQKLQHVYSVNRSEYKVLRIVSFGDCIIFCTMMKFKGLDRLHEFIRDDAVFSLVTLIIDVVLGTH